MKKHLKIFTLAILVGCSMQVSAQLASKKEVATAELAEKREQLKNEIIENYLAIKDKMVVSDSLAIQQKALQLKSSLGKFKFKKLSLEEMNTSTTARATMVQDLETIAATKNINLQRKTFAKLSLVFWQLAPKFKPEGVTIYQQKCPMTQETWMSNSKEIKNPYYPKNMLTCGEVNATL